MSLPLPRHIAQTRTHSGYADGQSVAVLRERVRAWLAETVVISAERVCDVVLATDEALANCADHAYRDHADGGEMTLELSYDAGEQAIEICVTDSGGWIEPAPVSVRGRGLRLMRALADDCTVDGRASGTTVRLHFLDCPASAPARRRNENTG